MIKSISIALAIAGVLAVAGCGGSSSNNSSSGGGGAYGGGEESTAASKEAKSETTAATPVAISVGSAPKVGKVLVDSKGFTLYYFEKDKGGKSACYGACAGIWPPLTGKPQAEGGAMSSELGTTKRNDGTTQVTYAGWPLYTYTADTKPGEDNGTDVKSYGGSWYPLHPNGEKAGH
jgi:predicted lipoprotein with Yx(FWY)xxD motif